MTLRLLSKTYWRGTWIRFREPVDDFADCAPATVYAHDGTQSRGLYWTPRKHPRPRVAVIAAHPRVDFSQHYAFPALLRAGYACLGANVRTLGNDTTCVHEQIILDLAAYVCWLKDRHGTRIVAAEALECPTLLENGFGEHNIQGIGDKHVPLIHNVMNSDVVVAVSDRATDALGVVFSRPEGREFLARRFGVPADIIAALSSFGLSSICNVLGAIKTADRLGLGPHDAIITVATDGDMMYSSEHEKTLAQHFPKGLDERVIEGELRRWLYETRADHVLELTECDRRRIFNLGYYTWVEQLGVSIPDFVARREQSFWQALRGALPRWDELIGEFNARTGALNGR